MNRSTFRPAALAAALALLLACTPDEQPPAIDAAVDAADAAAEVAPDAAADAPLDAEPADVPADTPADTPAEIALPQCASASDCPSPGPCWLSTCTSKGTCALAPTATGSPCDDGNACTTQDQCGSGLCVGTAKLACDDENACTTDKCNPVAGCLNLPVAASSACDDGDPCTQGDTCQQGQCESGQSVCQCKTTSDCAKFEDGNLCNGTLYCDKAGGSAYTCKVNPASVVSCATASNSACQTNTCVASTGQCKLVVAPGNTPCSDGEACTTGDFCDAGQCQGGTNTCYCKSDADCKGKEDGNLCNGSLFCNKATAQCQVNPASVVTCQTVDETACLKNLCNPKEGKCHLLPVKDGAICDDGNACTPNEACSKGECASAVNVCECQKDADCQAKEDGNLCNGTLYCDSAAGKCRVNPATVVTCDSGDDPACLADVCDPKTGKCAEIALPKDGTACDDGNSCTAQSFCQGGLCQGGANLCECQKDGDCAAKEDGNLCNGKLFCNPKSNKCEVNPATVVECPGAFDEECLTNQCDPATGSCGMKAAHQGNQCGGKTVCSAGGWCDGGQCKQEGSTGCECQNDSGCAKLDDGNSCNGTLYCNIKLPKPQCELNPATVVVCPIGGNTACVQSQCQPASGTCKMVALPGSCNDGLACTEQDGCSQGTCKGSPKACIDSLPCTADSCAEPFGCLHLPTAVSACDDGNACTASDACLGGKCIGTAKSCEDGNPCTTDSCHGEKGCQFNANSGLCSDGNPCTQLDLCKDGACIPGAPAKCDDGNLCTADSCDPATGSCKYVAGGSTCADSNPCTDEVCDPKLGCTHVANQADCNDGNACTTGDTCASSSCGGVGVQVCDDGKLCTTDSCDPKIGCVYKDNPAVCDDGDACTTDTCGAKACLHQPVVCDDGNPCTVDSCAKASGQCQVDAKSLDGKTCDADGDGCTLGDACLAGQCKAGAPVVCQVALKTCQQAACQSTGSKTFDCKAIAAADGTTCVGQDACIADAFCQAGACKLGSAQKLYAVELSAQGAGLQLQAVAEAADGLWVGGRSVAADETAAWWLQRLGKSGQALWSKAWGLQAPVPSKSTGIIGVIPVSGGLVVAGAVGTAQEGAQLRVVGLSLATTPSAPPTVLWDRTHGLAGQDERAERLAALNGGYAVVGRVESGAKHSGWVARLGATGLLQWSWQGGSAEGAALRALVQQGDGGVLAAGRSVSAGKGKAWLVRLDAQGKEQWQILHGNQADQGFEALVAQSGGEFVAAGWATVGGQPRLYLQRVDSAGGAVGAAAVGQSPHKLADALGAAGAQLWLAGQAFADPMGDAWLGSADATGHLAWSVDHDAGGAERLAALAALADGGLAAVGTLQPGADPTGAKGWVRRSDPWGRSSCGESGVCAGKTALDCADLNGCSDDLCDAKLGCISQANGLACSDGDACTSGDSCQGVSCQAGSAVSCDDGNACTADSCDKQKGCAHAALGGAPCPDDSVCTSGEVCQGSSCSVTQKGCDDGDPCTQDLCDPKAGCLNSALPEAAPCAAGKACIGGKCLSRFAKFISCGGGNPVNYALRHDGTVWSWGLVAPGSGNAYNSVPKAIEGFNSIVHLDTDYTAVCGVQSDGQVRCYGSSIYGTTGSLTCNSAVNAAPQIVPGLTDIASVDVGLQNLSAVTKGGQLWQLGANTSGQLGLGTCTAPTACDPVPSLHPTAPKLAGHSFGHSTSQWINFGGALDVEGKLWMAGASALSGGKCVASGSDGGYVGDASGAYGSASLLQVALPGKVISFANGPTHRCAVTADGTAWCWGSGSYGQIGDGGKAGRAQPTKVYAQPGKAIQIVAGENFSCALAEAGQVWCWGRNYHGNLGDGTTADSTTAVVVPGLDGVTQLSAGMNHVCALRLDGSVWCWGHNGPYSQGWLGTGSGVILSPKIVIGTAPQ